MSKYSSEDSYCYPQSDVLKNKFDIQDQNKLDNLEEEFVTLRSFELSEEPLESPFSVETIKYIHKKLFGDNFLQDLNKNDFAEKAAYYIAEINAIHPFREGNGRTQREFINQLAYNAGYYITWNKINSKDLLEATIDSFGSNYAILKKLIIENLKSLNDINSDSI